MGTRIRGEQVQVKVIKGGKDALLSERAVVALEYTPKQEIMEQGFLGETTNRHDEVYKGCSGTLTLQYSDKSVNKLIRDLNDRSRRATGASFKVNIVAVENYPDGDVGKLLFPDVKFGGQVKSYGARDSYGQITLPWACDEYTVL